jgi:hypothetical protein
MFVTVKIPILRREDFVGGSAENVVKSGIFIAVRRNGKAGATFALGRAHQRLANQAIGFLRCP